MTALHHYYARRQGHFLAPVSLHRVTSQPLHAASSPHSRNSCTAGAASLAHVVVITSHPRSEANTKISCVESDLCAARPIEATITQHLPCPHIFAWRSRLRFCVRTLYNISRTVFSMFNSPVYLLSNFSFRSHLYYWSRCHGQMSLAEVAMRVRRHSPGGSSRIVLLASI